MERKILSFITRNEIDESYNDHEFYDELFSKHKELLSIFDNVEVTLLKGVSDETFVFTNGSINKEEIRDWFFFRPTDDHSFAKKELDLIFSNDLTNSSYYNVDLVLTDEIDEFEVYTDSSRIIFRNDKILFISDKNEFDTFSISTDLLILWYENFRY